MIAPTGASRLFHRDGEPAVARLGAHLMGDAMAEIEGRAAFSRFGV